jgi:GT2 family glycosyltransferase
LHRFFPADSHGYFGRIKLIQNFSAVTAACLMTRRVVFNEMAGFDEKYARALNDVDFCLRLREKGYLVVYTPYAELYHHESLSRGSDYTEETFPLFRKTLEEFEARWANVLRKGDPYHNPNLTTSGNLVHRKRR